MERWGGLFELSNSINKDLVSKFGCDGSCKVCVERIVVGGPETSEGVEGGSLDIIFYSTAAFGRGSDLLTTVVEELYTQ